MRPNYRPLPLLCLALAIASCATTPPAAVTTASADAPVAAQVTSIANTGRLELQLRQAARRLMATIDDVSTLHVVLTGANNRVQDFDAALLNQTTSGGDNVAQGTVSFGALTPGSVTISVEARGSNGAALGASTTSTTITAGETAVATIDITLIDTHVTNPNGALEADVTVRDGEIVVDPIDGANARTGFPQIAAAPTVLATGFNFAGGVTVVGTKAFVCDSNNNAIKMVDVNTGVVTPVATAGEFANPWFITSAGTKVYVADSGGHNAIKVIDTANNNAVSTLVSGLDAGGLTVVGDKLYFVGPAETIKMFDLDDPTTVTTVVDTAAGLSGASGLATSGTKVYIADLYNNAIKAFDTTEGVNPTVTPVITTNLTMPIAVAVKDTKVFVADTYGHAIKMSTTTPGDPVTTLLGGQNEPRGIATDADGNVYVGGGWKNNLVRIPAVN